MDKEKLQELCELLPGITHDYQEDWQAERYHIGGKMFAMLGGDAERKPIITLKCEPNRAVELRETYKSIVPGYYMNKTHWNSLYLESDLSVDIFENLIVHSYNLVFEKLTKKVQKEIVAK
ncbi:MmcQ/YjbR family DNA-binding protein [Viridibacillus sp. NPDC093762]|uniref:MmcQ/YjbR family DNA-binding protein n=1 Tax=Viridibacillus sp. NPDC093762 TaxID=3390720 RepID=UPI003D05B1CA